MKRYDTLDRHAFDRPPKLVNEIACAANAIDSIRSHHRNTALPVKSRAKTIHLRRQCQASRTKTKPSMDGCKKHPDQMVSASWRTDQHLGNPLFRVVCRVNKNAGVYPTHDAICALYHQTVLVSCDEVVVHQMSPDTMHKFPPAVSEQICLVTGRVIGEAS